MTTRGIVIISIQILFLHFAFCNDAWSQYVRCHSLGFGYDFGNTLKRTSDKYSNDPKKVLGEIPTTSYFINYESPHHYFYFSARAFATMSQPVFSEHMDTYNDVEGQGTPSSIETRGYYYNYEEKTTRWGGLGRLHLLFYNPTRDVPFRLNTGFGFGFEKLIRYQVIQDEWVNYYRWHGSSYGPAPDYNIIYFDNRSEYKSAFTDKVSLDRNLKIEFFEFFINLQVRFENFFTFNIEWARRLYLKPYLGDVYHQKMDKYRYTALCLNFLIPCKKH